ncbi:MAG: tRNA (adenosine(37)-N6)-threonylcarbamoyltransferase complex dimerization subunit type 1 TsaB [Candidatus Nanopelagicales bacterium]
MLILAFDTATARVGAAVADGQQVLGEATAYGATRHGELLAPLVAAALAQAGADVGDLTAIGVGTGPGPYTGLRVGLVFAAVMGSARQVPVHGVCTLDVIGAEIAEFPGAPAEFAVATDARRREVYWARYRGSERIAGPGVATPAAVAAELGAPLGPRAQSPGVPCFGAGAVLHTVLAHPHFPPGQWPEYPDLGVLARLVAGLVAAGVAPDPPLPRYLRRPDAEVNPARKPVLPR